MVEFSHEFLWSWVFLLGILLISFSISLLVINMFNIFISSEFNFGVSDTLLALQNINFKVFLNDPIDFIGVCCYNSPFTFTSINWDFFPILFTNLARGLSILLPFKEKNFLASSIYWRLVGLCFIKSCFNLYGFFFCPLLCLGVTSYFSRILRWTIRLLENSNSVLLWILTLLLGCLSCFPECLSSSFVSRNLIFSLISSVTHCTVRSVLSVQIFVWFL